MILSRPNGIILRSAGPLFAHAPARPAASASRTASARDRSQVADAREADSAAVPGEEGRQEEEEEGQRDPPPAHSELARRYARAASRIVDSVRTEVRDVDEEADVS